MPIVAVTGAAGYVGSRLLQVLPDSARAIVRSRVDHLPQDRQTVVDLVEPDSRLEEALTGTDTVVHLAGHNEVVARDDPPRALLETIRMARNVGEAAARAGANRLVYLSTIHVYGDQLRERATLSVDVAPEPRNVYAVARLTCEHLLRVAAPQLEVVALRLSNAVGAPAAPAVDRWTLVASDLARQAVRTGTMTLRTPGLQWRDFIGLRDVCRIIAAAADPSQVQPGTYNLASGTSQTIRDVADVVGDAMEAATGRRPVLHAPAPEGPAPAPFMFDVEGLAAQGHAAAADLRDGVDEIVRFCIDHKDHL